MNTDEAYQQCEQITWEQARNFAYGIRLLPPAKRRSLAAVYAFARRIDDIGDGDLAPEIKAAQLEQARGQVQPAGGGGQGRQGRHKSAPGTAQAAPGTAAAPCATAAAIDENDPVLVALVDSGARFDVPLAAFTELIDGCLADVNQASYKTFDVLLWYCRCVAGLPIGRLSLGIYGAQPPGEAGQAGRRPRGRAADHQHPARCPRGLPQQPHLPPGRGPDQVRHRVRPPRSASPEPFPYRGHAGAVRDPGRVRGGPRPRVVRSRPAWLLATIDRRSARPSHRRDGGHLPPPARPDRGQPARGPRGPDVPAGQ